MWREPGCLEGFSGAAGLLKVIALALSLHLLALHLPALSSRASSTDLPRVGLPRALWNCKVYLSSRTC